MEEGEQPKKVQVLITKELIADALFVSNAGTSIKAKKDLTTEVFTKKDPAATFHEMVCRQVEMPTEYTCSSVIWMTKDFQDL